MEFGQCNADRRRSHYPYLNNGSLHLRALFPIGRIHTLDPATDIGVELYSPIGTGWNVRAAGPTSSASMLMASIRTMKLDRDGFMVYRYRLIYGDLPTIRSRVYQLRDL